MTDDRNPGIITAKPSRAPASATVLRRRKAGLEPTPPPITKPPPLPPERNGPAACCQAYAAEIKQRRKAKREVRLARAPEKRSTKSCGRLPDDSAFAVTYDATAQTWSGSLVTTVNGQSARFEATAGAVLKLLVKLDRLYRVALELDATKDNAQIVAPPSFNASDTVRLLPGERALVDDRNPTTR